MWNIIMRYLKKCNKSLNIKQWAFAGEISKTSDFDWFPYLRIGTAIFGILNEVQTMGQKVKN